MQGGLRQGRGKRVAKERCCWEVSRGQSRGGPVSQVEGFRVESKGSYEPVTENLYQWIPWEVQRDGTTG